MARNGEESTHPPTWIDIDIDHATMMGSGYRPLETGSNISLIYIEGVWSLSNVVKSHMVALPCWYPPHSVLWSHYKWNQSNFFSHQNPSLCVAKLELKRIDTFQWFLQKWPRRGAWLLVLVGFWVIEKLRIFVKMGIWYVRPGSTTCVLLGSVLFQRACGRATGWLIIFLKQKIQLPAIYIFWGIGPCGR